MGLLPALAGSEGRAYALVATLGGAIMLALAWRVWRDSAAHANDRAAKQLFAFSIVYLFALFATVLAGHLVTRWMGA